MNIIVCVKRVLDPAIPPVKFVINEEQNRVVPPQGIPQVINPYDAHALELALRLKGKHGGRITALSIEESGADEIMRQALAMGADDAILLSDAMFAGSDSFRTASVLAKAIKRIGDYQLIMCGRQAVDWDEGVVAAIIAENLGLPLITLAVDATPENGKLRVRRVTMDGYEVFDTPLPAVISVSNEVGKPRLPTGLGIIAAARRKLTIWGGKEIGVGPAAEGAAGKRLVKLFVQEQKRACEFITGESEQVIAAEVAARLKGMGII